MTPITAYEARDRFGVPSHRVHLWRTRGQLTPVDYAAKSPRYDPSAVQRLNAKAEAHPRAKRPSA